MKSNLTLLYNYLMCLAVAQARTSLLLIKVHAVQALPVGQLAVHVPE
jgi:hypothetical protein